MTEDHAPAILAAPAANVSGRSEMTEALRPAYVERLPPCNLTCPAGENVQEWLQLAQAGRLEEAWGEIVRNNPLPAIHGRVCYHPCENGCNRKRLDGAVSIHAVERFLGDLAIEKGWSIAPGAATGKRVLVIGSGPCGLSGAFHLALSGHAVTVFEAGAKLGGMMRYGIPEYRLPRDILDAEIDRIARMGVDFKTRRVVGDLDRCMKEGQFDAVLLAIGAQLSKRVDIPTVDAGRIVDALKFLAETGENSGLCVGRRVAVYGGGNTAMDAARTAVRLGAQEAIIIYRRNQARMPAHPSELEEALLEGVVVNWQRTIKRIDEGEIQVEVMELDGKGQPRATGQMETIRADMLILALGQETQSDFLKNVPGLVISSEGVVQVDGSMMTAVAGIFAGGDMVPFNKTVTTAVGHGKKAARHIDAYVRETTYQAGSKHASARLDRLRVEYYQKAAPALQPALDAARRHSTFEETVGGLSEATAMAEAHRCFSCGNCFECDTCRDVCPDQAISKLGRDKGYDINMDQCSRCGLCTQRCPCGAMEMLREAVAPGWGGAGSHDRFTQ